MVATRSARFPLNSASKSFTGVAMAQLAQDGRVDLDAPASRYLDDLPESWRAVRVRQLLAHTSGLPDILDAERLMGGGSEQAAWQAVGALPAEAAAGERFQYNRTNYVLLARIIAQQSGMPYERFLATRQFSTARMARTTFGDSYDLIPDAATMYSYLPHATDAKNATPRLSHWFYDMPPSLWAGGGILTTADDTARWLVALQDGHLLERRAMQQMWTAERLHDGSAGDWAAGWPVFNTAPDLQVGGHGRCALGLHRLSRARPRRCRADQSGRRQSAAVHPAHHRFLFRRALTPRPSHHRQDHPADVAGAGR